MKKSIYLLLCFIVLILPAKAVDWLSLAKQESWRVSGSIIDSKLKFDHLFQEETIPIPSKDEGPYTLQVRGATDAVLYTRHFMVSTPVFERGPGSTPQEPNIQTFSEWIPFRPEAASIVILGPKQNELGTIKLGGEPPKITIVSPATGFLGTGKQTISWMIANPRSIKYDCEIFYSENGGTIWEPRNVGDCPKLSPGGTMSDIIDFSATKPASSAHLRIYVSDGINTGRATSISFEVPKHAPQMFANIFSPPNGLIQPASQPVYLEGTINDSNVSDGILAKLQLQWSSDIQGPIGNGNKLYVHLKPGTHKITLLGTNGEGYKISATTTVVTSGQPPEVNITVNQTANGCMAATIDARPGNEGANLDGNIYYSYKTPHGWADKMHFPVSDLPYTFKIPGVGNVDIYATAVDKSRQTNSKQITTLIPSSCAQ